MNFVGRTPPSSRFRAFLYANDASLMENDDPSIEHDDSSLGNDDSSPESDVSSLENDDYFDRVGSNRVVRADAVCFVCTCRRLIDLSLVAGTRV